MMMRIISIIIASLAVVCTAQAAPVWSTIAHYLTKNVDQPPPTIRVLVLRDNPDLDIEIEGKFKAYDPRTGSRIMSRKTGKTGNMFVTGDGLKWGESFPGIHQILIVPDEMTNMVRINGKEYPGSIYVYDVDGKLSVVNRIGLEEYLSSVLSPVFIKDAPEELLAAMAITARTNAYFFAENPLNPYWAVNGDQVGYDGWKEKKEDSPIDRAIALTRNMVMSRRNSYDDVVSPFPSYWKNGPNLSNEGRLGISSKINYYDAEGLANEGNDASQILSKAFPGSLIQLATHSPGHSH